GHPRPTARESEREREYKTCNSDRDEGLPQKSRSEQPLAHERDRRVETERGAAPAHRGDLIENRDHLVSELTAEAGGVHPDENAVKRSHQNVLAPAGRRRAFASRTTASSLSTSAART